MRLGAAYTSPLAWATAIALQSGKAIGVTAHQPKVHGNQKVAFSHFDIHAPTLSRISKEKYVFYMVDILKYIILYMD